MSGRRRSLVMAILILLGMLGQTVPAGSAVPVVTEAGVKAGLVSDLRWLDGFWRGWFAERGIAKSPVLAYFLVGDEKLHTENCGYKRSDGTREYTWSSTSPTAIYCYRHEIEWRGTIYTDIIIFPVGRAVHYMNGTLPGREINQYARLAPLAILAHEFAHYVTFELREQTNVPLPEAPDYELIADCLAGVAIANYAYEQRKSEPDHPPSFTNVELAALQATFQAIADPPERPGTHGTAEQRKEAFDTGRVNDSGSWTGGTDSRGVVRDGARACFETYWPAYGY